MKVDAVFRSQIVVFSLVSLMLMSGCVGMRSSGVTEWAPAELERIDREEVREETEELEKVNNSISTAGVTFLLPEGWRAARALPGSTASADHGVSSALMTIFSEEGKRTGWFYAMRSRSKIDSSRFIPLFIRSTISTGAEDETIEIVKPSQSQGRSHYLITRKAAGEQSDTALWIGKTTRIKRNERYDEFTGQSDDEQMEYTAAYAISVEHTDSSIRKAVLSSFIAGSDRLEGRYLPATDLRFISSGVWWYLADYRDGILVGGSIEGTATDDEADIFVAVYPVAQEADPVQLLGDTSIGSTRPQKTNGEFFIKNEILQAPGAVQFSEAGTVRSCFILPPEVNGRPWCVEIEAPAYLVKSAHSSDMSAGEAVTALPAVQALFERQLFFGWEREAESAHIDVGRGGGE